MKKIMFKFSVSTQYVGSKVTNDIELEFDDDATDDEIEEQVEQVWCDWRDENTDGGWERL